MKYKDRDNKDLSVMRRAKRVCVVTTAACITSNIEGERLKEFFILNGCLITTKINKADLVVVNTCGFRKGRLDDSLKSIRKAKREKKKDASLMVCGCLPDIDRRSLQTVFNGVSLGPRFYDRLDEIFNARIKFSSTRKSFSLKNKAFTIPICKGCVWNCSYCVIKKARGGNLESRPVHYILKDVKKALRKGCKVIELIGEDVGSYGIDIGTNLPNLLKKIIGIKGKFSVVLWRVNPHWLVKYFDSLRKIFKSPKITFLSIPIQSGSDKILRRMNRIYRIEDVKMCIKALRKECPHVKLFSQFIVGFPGETEKDFLKTLNFVRESNIDTIMPFKLTLWQDCPAYKYKDVVEKAVIEERCRRLKKEEWINSWLNQFNTNRDLDF